MNDTTRATHARGLAVLKAALNALSDISDQCDGDLPDDLVAHLKGTEGPLDSTLSEEIASMLDAMQYLEGTIGDPNALDIKCASDSEDAWDPKSAEVTYTGYFLAHGERIQVDFTAPANASVEETDAAFWSAVAHGAQYDYLVIGSDAQNLADTKSAASATSQSSAHSRPDTTFKVRQQGAVKMAHCSGYLLAGGPDAVCLFIDPSDPAQLSASTVSDQGCPVIHLAREGSEDLTEIEFTEFPGWRFHAGSGGKTIAIAIVREGAIA